MVRGKQGSQGTPEMQALLLHAGQVLQKHLGLQDREAHVPEDAPDWARGLMDPSFAKRFAHWAALAGSLDFAVDLMRPRLASVSTPPGSAEVSYRVAARIRVGEAIEVFAQRASGSRIPAGELQDPKNREAADLVARAAVAGFLHARNYWGFHPQYVQSQVAGNPPLWKKLVDHLGDPEVAQASVGADLVPSPDMRVRSMDVTVRATIVSGERTRNISARLAQRRLAARRTGWEDLEAQSSDGPLRPLAEGHGTALRALQEAGEMFQEACEQRAEAVRQRDIDALREADDKLRSAARRLEDGKLGSFAAQFSGAVRQATQASAKLLEQEASRSRRF